jgi:hypothetical protein
MQDIGWDSAPIIFDANGQTPDSCFADNLILSPGGVYSKALLTRLPSACSTRAGSGFTSGRLGSRFTVKLFWLCSA